MEIGGEKRDGCLRIGLAHARPIKGQREPGTWVRVGSVRWC
jgi:hypothetical protein